jgi:hypothetical protein
MAEKNFVNGLIVKRHEKAPSFVVCALSFKTEEFTDYIMKNQVNGWLNVDVKLSNGGKYYAELNTYVKGQQQTPKVVEEEKNQAELNNIETIEYPTEEINPEDIPF